MKHLKPTLLLTLIALLTACDKLPSSDALNGKWLLTARAPLPSIPTSEATPAISPTAPTYWSFQLNLLSITTAQPHNGYTSETVARYAHTADSLHITHTYIHFRDRDSLLLSTPTPPLTNVALQGAQSHYRIERLDATTLVLTTQAERLTFHHLE